MNGIINAVRKLLGLAHRGTAKINKAVSSFEKTLADAEAGVAHLQESIVSNGAAQTKAEEIFRTTLAALEAEAAKLVAESERGLRFIGKVTDLLN
jgi:hypothetical protein